MSVSPFKSSTQQYSPQLRKTAKELQAQSLVPKALLPKSQPLSTGNQWSAGKWLKRLGLGLFGVSAALLYNRRSSSDSAGLEPGDRFLRTTLPDESSHLLPAPESLEQERRNLRRHHGRKTASPTDPYLAALAKRPWRPTDINMFNKVVYSQASQPEPAAGPGLDADQLRSQLTDSLNNRFNGNGQVNNALALLNNDTLKAKIDDIRLRVAAVNLKGTAGEAVLNDLLAEDGLISQVRFYNYNDPSFLSSAGSDPNQPGKTIISVSDRYQYENPLRFTAPIAHEGLHTDQTVTAREERMAHNLETLTDMQVLLSAPWLASQGTELARRKNTETMGLLNSGNEMPGQYLNEFTSQGDIFPAPEPYDCNDPSVTRPIANFASSFQGPFTASSPGNSVLTQELKATTGKNAKNPAFDDVTETFLATHTNLTPKQITQVAKILKLNLSSTC